MLLGCTAHVKKYLSSGATQEVETPVLIKSTPEGARDFVVPSRMNPGQPGARHTCRRRSCFNAHLWFQCLQTKAVLCSAAVAADFQAASNGVPLRLMCQSAFCFPPRAVSRNFLLRTGGRSRSLLPDREMLSRRGLCGSKHVFRKLSCIKSRRPKELRADRQPEFTQIALDLKGRLHIST